MTEDDLDPETKKALEERIEWIKTVTDLCRERGADAIQKPIDEIDDEHLRSMICVLIIARAGDRDAAMQLVREHEREEMLRAIRDAERPSDAEIDALRDYIMELEEYVRALKRPSLS